MKNNLWYDMLKLLQKQINVLTAITFDDYVVKIRGPFELRGRKGE